MFKNINYKNLSNKNLNGKLCSFTTSQIHHLWSPYKQRMQNHLLQEMQRLKKLKDEQEKLADIKVMEYLKEKLVSIRIGNQNNRYFKMNRNYVCHSQWITQSIRSKSMFIVWTSCSSCLFSKAREEAFQEELEGQRIEREKEIARLRAQQEQAKDKQAEQVFEMIKQLKLCSK